MPELPRAPRACDDSPGGQSEYHRRWSSRFRRCKIVSIAAFALLVLLIIGLFGTTFTYADLRSLVRDLDAEYSSDADGNIRYDASSTMRFALFGEAVAVATPSAHMLYKPGSARVYCVDAYYSSPEIVSSSASFICYDLGGYDFSVYHALGRAYRETLSYPIRDVSLAENGTFAVVTQSREYRSSVLVYDKKFDRIGKYENNRYVQKACLTQNGEYVLIVSFDAENGEYYSVISLYPTSGTSPKFERRENGSFPIDAVAFDDGRFAVLYGDRVCFYSSDGSVASTYSYGARTLTRAAFGARDACLIFSASSGASTADAVLLDSAGKSAKSLALDGKAVDCGYYDDTLMLLGKNSLTLVRDGDVVATCAVSGADAKRLLPYAPARAVIAYSDHAELITIPIS